MRLHAIYGIAALAGILACVVNHDNSKDIAGTSVGTGNPGKVKVGFTEEGRSVTLTGKVEIFGVTQIPVPHFQPSPLISDSISKSDHFDLMPAQFAQIPDSSWPIGSCVGDSLCRFNLVIRGESLGIGIYGIQFHRISKSFAMPEANKFTTARDSTLEIDVALERLQDLRFILPADMKSISRHDVIFALGTGFYAFEDSSALDSAASFTFSRMPPGKYEYRYFALPDEENHNVSGQDSVNIYLLSNGVTTGDTVAIGVLQEKIRLPEELIFK